MRYLPDVGEDDRPGGKSLEPIFREQLQRRPADLRIHASIKLRGAKRDGAPGVKASFDAKYGFPREIETVVMRWATDSTFTYHVDNYQRLDK